MRYMRGIECYVAVVAVKSKVRNGNTGQIVDCVVTDRIGPYDKPGPAKAQVTLARKERGSQFVDGWVEIYKSAGKLDD